MSLSRKILSRKFCDQPQPLGFDSYFDGAVLQREKVNLIYGTCSDQPIFRFEGTEYKCVSNGKYWHTFLPPIPAGGPYTMEIVCLNQRSSVQVFFGDVFLLAGQSNMEWTMAQCASSDKVSQELTSASDNLLRLFNIHCDFCENEREQLKENVAWVSATGATVENFSSLGYLFGKYYRARTNVPVGLVATAVGGTSLTFWQESQTQKKLVQDGVQIFVDKTQPIFTPSIGYNALINPLTANSYKAVLWYQGESNTENELHFSGYHAQLVALINSWRKQFGDSTLHFSLFQLARFENNQKGFCEVNFQINKVAENLSHCNVVVTHDLGEFHNIHPADKSIPAKRAVDSFLATTGKAYCTAKPMKLKSVQRTEKGVLLVFDNVYDGIVVKNRLNGLSVSSDGKTYRLAEKYSIEKDSILLLDENIRYVRYGFDCKTYAEAEADVSLLVSLYNSRSMPLDLFSIQV